MAINPTDLFLVQRAGLSYSVLASEVIAADTSDLQGVTDAGNHTTNSIKVGGTEASPSASVNSDGTMNCTDLFTQDIHLNNEGRNNDVDGTWGDWTLQEGEENLFHINNRSGMKFKISMEPA